MRRWYIDRQGGVCGGGRLTGWGVGGWVGIWGMDAKHKKLSETKF